MSTPIPPALEALFDQYFNQTITPEGMAQLEAWLAEKPEHAQMLARAGLAHGLTREVVKRKMQSNLRPRVLHFAKPVLLAASVLLVVGIGMYLSTAQKKKVAPTAAMTAVERENRELAELEKAMAGLREKVKGAQVAATPAPLTKDMSKLTPEDKAQRVNQLLLTSRSLQRNGQNAQALATAEQALAADPKSLAAQMLTEMLKDELYLRSSNHATGYSRNDVVSGLSPIENTSVARSTISGTGSLSAGSPTVTNGVDSRLVDTDGKGAGDSLWFYPKTSKTGEMRYVGATRIMDLNEKLNFNTSLGELAAAKKSEGAYESSGSTLLGTIEAPELEPNSLRTTISIPDHTSLAHAALGGFSRDQYAHIYDNKFASPLIQPLSTFSVDVDTAAYANVRRFVNEGQLPPPDAVRIEEMLNYFSYDYAPPTVLKPGEAIGAQAPFAAHTEVCACPWNTSHKLVRIGLKGAEVDMSKRPPAHLTFLVDVSGSMDTPDRLPLAKAALVRLLAQLRPDDHVSLVVYAGNTGVVLEDAPCSEKAQILGAIDHLSAGGSTNGAGGIQQAYEMAQKHFVKGGVNRVILCTDGDFNVGTSDTGSLIRLAKEKANPANGEGVYLSTCGFGRDNLNDHMMEQIADAGNGNYSYIDSLAEAEKVFVKQAGGTLVTIAKDVKLQLEFNPAKVGKYRLIGYENRVLKAEDFNDDTVDAGDIGAGHTVTALYEIEPAGANPYASVDEEIKDLERQMKKIEEVFAAGSLTAEATAHLKQALDGLQARIAQLKKPAADRSVDPLAYQSERKISEAAQAGGDLLTLKLRYKSPEAKAEQGTSKLLKFTLKDADTAFEKAGADTRFAASVAAYGMILRGSEFKGTATLKWVEQAANGTVPSDDSGVVPPSAIRERAAQRADFVTLVRKAQSLMK